MRAVPQYYVWSPPWRAVHGIRPTYTKTPWRGAWPFQQADVLAKDHRYHAGPEAGARPAADNGEWEVRRR